MIRIAVMYPNDQDKQFDLDYYRNQHMPLVVEKYNPHGLQGVEIDEAKVKTGPQAAPFLVIGYMLFDSVKSFMQAYEAAGKEVISDISNFTDIEPQIQISEYSKL